MSNQENKALILGIEDQYEIDTKLFCRFLDQQNLDINIDSLAEWVKHLAESGYAAATINRRVSAIKSRFRFLFEECGDEAFNVLARFCSEQSLKKVKGMKLNTRAVAPEKILTPEEVKILIDKGTSRMALVIEFLYTTGCRISELTGAMQCRVKRNREYVTVRIIGKGSKERPLSISIGLYRRIDREFQGNKFMFETVSGDPYNRHYLGREIRNLGYRCLGKRVTPHMFRHTFGTSEIKKTGQIKGVADYLGHGTVNVLLDMYTHEQLSFLDLPKIK